MTKRVLHPLIRFLRSIGWQVRRDERIYKHYRSLSPHHRYCRFGDLEASLEVNGRHLKFEMYQNVRMKGREKGDGKYEFGKMKIMPYLLKLRAKWTINKVVEHLTGLHGYRVVPADPEYGPFGVTALEWIQWKYKEGWHYKEELGRPDWHSDYNRRSGDGELLDQGMPVYFKDYEGRWGRGVAYYNLNNMWWVAVGKWNVRNIACFDIFVRPPPEIYQRVTPEKRRRRLEEELQRAVLRLDYQRALVLKRILFGDRPLYRIYSEKNELWWSTSCRGYTKDKAVAGLYEAHELPKNSVDLRFEAVA